MDAIIAKNVSKKFRQASSTTLKTFLLRDLWKRAAPQKAFWALKDISISVKKGSTFGIIGQNGSGKSTLLKIVAGILAPDAGGCIVNGRISALIELGAGFHPDFSGRENIYINGMLLGLSKKTIHKKMDEIIEFSELRDFIDEPVRTYSSGMYSRLGFSVAVSVDPDVLLIDEVFAVGDEGFVHKCKSKMNEFKKKGKSILFVTHDLGTVENWCDEAMWLDSGVMGVAGPVGRTVDAYRRSVRLKEASRVQGEAGAGADGRGSKAIEITGVRFLAHDKTVRAEFNPGEAMLVEITCRANKPVEDPSVGIGIWKGDGSACCYSTSTHAENLRLPVLEGAFRLFFMIEDINFVEGVYLLTVSIEGRDGFVFDRHAQRYQFVVYTNIKDGGIYRPKHRWVFDHAGV